MRPLSLEITNLTSLRNPGLIDFRGLDLFAIWGPTGAGKSSLVDAITFALFGQVPRLGKNIKELISLGEDRMSVRFEFGSGGATYRVHRATSRRGAAPVQLERRHSAAAEWEPVADRANEVTTEIERVLGMDYDAFIRSVLLPQGEFDQFLAGDRVQRRRIIDGLLRLDVYAEMHRLANAMAANAQAEANRIHERLDTELADATPEALKLAKAELKELESRAKRMKSQLESAAAAQSATRRLAGAREREAAENAALATAQEQLDAATQTLAGGEGALKELDARIAAVEAEKKAANYDAAAHMKLNQCLPLLQNLEALVRREQRLAADAAAIGHALDRLRKDARAATSAHQAAQAEAAAKRDAFSEAQRNNAAAVLVQDLRPGDPCPICGQPVGEVKHAVRKDFAQLKKAADDAQAAEARARDALTAAERQVALKEQEADSTEKQLADLRKQIEKGRAEAERLLPEPGLSTQDVSARIEALDQAKRRLDELGEDERRLRQERQQAAALLASAQASVAGLEAERKLHQDAAAKAAAEASAAAAELGAVARSLGWDDVCALLESGRDPSPAIERRERELRNEETEVHRNIGGHEKLVAQIEKDIKLANELRDNEKSLRETARLAGDLASLLRTNAFPTFIRERSLRALAEDGTRHLNEVSRGRFDLGVDGDDFYVLDRWNGGERRSVKTLSGGETFLASLALALALAEQLPSLAGDTTATTLESLFIDEGFSNLDEDTLDDVASALEILGRDGTRVVGVITHLPGLAERMPARITVHKSQSGSTITID